jgi:RNA polymerase sigma factor (TIGR02999 family)
LDRSIVTTLTELIHLAASGDAEATERLFAATYPELRKLARSRLRAGGRQTLLDTGSLVHESYLRFAGAGQLRLEDRLHFLRWAAKVMRSIIVDFARRRAAGRRGGDWIRITWTPDLDPPGPSAAEDDIVRMHEALDQLATKDARMAEIVQMRYFAGMRETDIAAALGVTDRTVRREWEKARRLLQILMSGSSDSPRS